MLRQSNAEVLNPKKSRYNGFVKNLTNLIIINVGHVVKKFNFQAYKSHKTPPAIQKWHQEPHKRIVKRTNNI